MKNQELEDRFSYEFESWKNTLGFEPVELLATRNVEEPYEKNEMHVFKLKRGYAIVHERGCSCYESRDASIDILETKTKLKESLQNMAKVGYSEGGLARSLLEELMMKSPASKASAEGI